MYSSGRKRLCTVAPGAFLAIEHIGRTAVSGLIAKPIVDIMAGIASLADVGALIRQLCDNGTRRQPKSTRR